MADPLTGLATIGAVSSILQVIDFGAKCIAETKRLIESGDDALRENITIERLVLQHDALSDRLISHNNASRPLTSDEQAVDDLARECKKESRVLLRTLDDLKIEKGLHRAKRVWISAVQAARAVKKRKSIETQQKYLSELNNQLSTVLLQITRCTQLQGFEDTLDSHSNATRTVLESQNAIRQAIENYGKQHVTHLDQRFAENKIWLESRIAMQDEMDKAESIIDSLRFPELRKRRDAIEEAHSRTFEWLFRDDVSPFHQWLRSDERLFWVSGKAGSGKSTLMKYISSNARTKDILGSWSGGKRLIVVDSYLWNPGNELQRTEQGLLQGLLHQLLKACPNLVEVATPRRWNERPAYLQNPEPWSRMELIEALDNIVQDRSNDAFFCFFIDGLDEYHGDYSKLITTIKYLAQHPRMKLCVSSRPWNVFRKAFKDLDASLYVDELTRNDIRLYVEDELQSIAASGSRIDTLVEQVVGKADGVFLWVFLVVRSLREGFEEGDDLSILQQRVLDFPADLEDYFRLILHRVSSTYKRHTAQALKIAMITLGDSKPRIHAASSFLSFWLISQGLENASFAFHRRIRYFSNDELRLMAISTRDFLSACCKDFLHMPSLRRKAFDLGPMIYEVEFLHRTVYDFLGLPDIKHVFDSVVPSHFRSQVFPCHLAIARSKVVPRDCERSDLCEHITFVIATAFPAGAPEQRSATESVAELETIAKWYLREVCPTGCEFHKPAYVRPWVWRQTVEQFLAHGHDSFVRDVIARVPGFVQSTETDSWSFLVPVLGLSPFKEFSAIEVNLDMVDILLRHGANPNNSINSPTDTGWARFVVKLAKNSIEERRNASNVATMHGGHAAKVVRIMIAYGAELHKAVEMPQQLPLTSSSLPRSVPIRDLLQEIGIGIDSA